MTLTIALDVDGVVADLHTEWLRRYNLDYAQNLRVEDLKSWRIVEHVVPDCGTAIYDYLRDDDLYDAIVPLPRALDAVTALRHELGCRVIFVTSCVPGAADQKIRWLRRHGFIEPAAAGSGDRDVVICHEKSLVRCDLLVDDYEKNLEGRDNGILWDAPYNRHVEGVTRADSWWAVLQLVREMQAPKIVTMSGHATAVRPPETVLQEADRLVSGDRQASYGHPLDNWSLAAELMTPIAFKAITERGSLSYQDALLMMNQVKVARQLHAPKRDNLVDIGGYAKCLDLALTADGKR